MSKIAVVYWSGTGNTEAMANLVADGAKAAGAEVSVVAVSDFSASQMDAFDAVAFGCPSMGAEQLEDSEFEPVFIECEAKLSGKKLGWMRTWEETCRNDGAVLVADGVICNGAPDSEAEEACKALGAALA